MSQVPNTDLGYPKIEALIESEKFEAFNQSFGDAYKALEVIVGDVKQPLKKQKEARLAMKAFELTTDLIKELLQIKYQMAQSAAKTAGKK